MGRTANEIMNEVYPTEVGTGLLLVSAARTASTNTSDQVRPIGARGVRVYISATAATSTPSVVFTIEDKDPVSGTYSTLLASAAITGISTAVLTVYPGLTAATNVVATMALPKTWRVKIVAGNSDSLTYSVGFSYLY